MYVCMYVWCVIVCFEHPPPPSIPLSYCACRRTTTANTRGSAMVFEYVIDFFRSEKMGPQQALFSFFSLFPKNQAYKILHVYGRTYVYHNYVKKSRGDGFSVGKKEEGRRVGAGEPQRQAAAACGR